LFNIYLVKPFLLNGFIYPDIKKYPDIQCPSLINRAGKFPKKIFFSEISGNAGNQKSREFPEISENFRKLPEIIKFRKIISNCPFKCVEMRLIIINTFEEQY
jgi:hypothetical protein